ncbi:MAG: hypothetical protein EOM88_03770 [Clostridia bacterium]|nr:hypothetical protein [Clostridia bacterium]
MSNRKLIKTKLTGFSLMEVIVSTAIFVIVILSMTGIFKMVVDAQRQAIASQNVEESLRYFLEVISKEIRMAQKNGGQCPHISHSSIFGLASNELGDILYLRNYHDDCISYSLVNDNGVNRFSVSKSSLTGMAFTTWLSPRRVNISELHFTVHEKADGQAYVTINLSANYVGKEAGRSKMRVQTSISSRHYRP